MLTRRTLVPLLFALGPVAGLLALPVQRPTEPVEEPLHLIVLHTNDMHGQVLPLPATWVRDVDPIPQSGGLARVGGYIREVRARAEREGDRVLVVDAGDWYQGTPEGNLDKGLGIVRALATMGYDALCVGNHEFDHGVQHVEHLLEQVPLPALLANARQPSGSSLPGTQDHLVVDLDGVRVAVVGILSTHTPQMSHPTTRTLEWEEPADCLRRVREDLADDDVDLVLPVTHVGVDEDRVLARAHPDLPLIVGGHSHTFLPNGTREGSTWVVQSGSKARGIGRVDLYLDPETHEVLRDRTTVQVVNLLEPYTGDARNAALETLCEELVSRSAEVMDHVVGRFEAPLTRGRDPLRTSPAGNLITDLMRARTGADVAIHNNGGTRAELPAGEVTRRDLFRVLPFDNNLVTVRMSGAELEALMRRSVEGSARSGLTFSGMTLGVARGRGEESDRLLGILVGERFLDPRASYEVTTNSFLASGGDAYAELVHGKDRREDPALQRDLLEEALLAGPVTPPDENRFLVQ